MKKHVLLLVVAASLTTASFAQRNEKDSDNKSKRNANVPAAAKQAFEKQYPGSSAKWNNENGKYEAGFKHNGHEMSVLYNANGTVEETEMEIPVSQLPAGAASYISQHKRGKISEAAKITREDGEVNYEAEVKGKDLIFDSAGKFLKEVKG